MRCVPLSRIAWLVTVAACLVTAVLLLVASYQGYARPAGALGARAAINLRGFPCPAGRRLFGGESRRVGPRRGGVGPPRGAGRGGGDEGVEGDGHRHDRDAEPQ